MIFQSFFWACFTSSQKNFSVQHYAKIPDYYTCNVICFWRGSKTRLFQKLHINPISPHTVCFPKSPKVFTETTMRQVLGWHCPIISVPVSQRDEEKPRQEGANSPQCQVLHKSHGEVLTYSRNPQFTISLQEPSCKRKTNEILLVSSCNENNSLVFEIDSQGSGKEML